MNDEVGQRGRRSEYEVKSEQTTEKKGKKLKRSKRAIPPSCVIFSTHSLSHPLTRLLLLSAGEPANDSAGCSATTVTAKPAGEQRGREKRKRARGESRAQQ